MVSRGGGGGARAATLALALAAAAAWLLAGWGAYEGFDVRVGRSKWGRGVFATRDFRAGEIVEKCPAVFAPDDAWGEALRDYVFRSAEGETAMPMGYCAMYNHQDDPNTEYTFDRRRKNVVMRATRDIAEGEEIFDSYGDEWWASRDLTPGAAAGAAGAAAGGQADRAGSRRPG